MRHLKLTYNLLVALIAIAGFSGCSQDEFVERQEMQPQIEAQFTIISMPQIGTRAVDGEKNIIRYDRRKQSAVSSHCLLWIRMVPTFKIKQSPEKIWKMNSYTLS